MFAIVIGMIICFSVNWVKAGTVDEGLVAYWPMDGNAEDASGNGNDGTVSGATLVEDRNGNTNSAYYFDGVNDMINIGNNVKPAFPISVSVWFKDGDIDNAGTIFRNDHVDSGAYRYGFMVRELTASVSRFVLCVYKPNVNYTVECLAGF